MDFVIAASQTWWQNLVYFIVSIVVTVLLPPLLAYVIALLRKKNVKVDFDTTWALVEKAVTWGEQWWKKKLNEGADPANKAAETLNAVTDYAAKLMEQYGLGKMARDKLIDLIEAKVGDINSKKAENVEVGAGAVPKSKKRKK